jgi:regulatory protein
MSRWNSRPEASDDSDWDPARLRRLAMDLLARREHTRAELTAKLTARGAGADAVAPVLDILENDGLLSEARFAEAFVRQRTGRGHGPVRIRHELGQRGVSEAAVDQALAAADADWDQLAVRVRHGRFGADPPADLKDRARQSRFLTYRGFTGDQVRRALDA